MPPLTMLSSETPVSSSRGSYVVIDTVGSSSYCRTLKGLKSSLMSSTESRSLNFFSFQRKYYDSVIPQTAFFPNNKSCQGFEEFISATIIDRVRNGSFLVWRKVNDVQPPYLVMPITVEPSEPRMCHDERFLNLWIRDLPFLLDYITSLPRYVFKSHYQTTFDDKSGYDHILYPQRVLPLWDSNGKGGTSVIKPYHLVGKPVLTSITPSA